MKVLSRKMRLKFLQAVGFSVLLIVSAVVCLAEPDSPPQVESVAPGVWRLRFGNPEQFTPTHFRSKEMDAAGLEKMATKELMPLDAATISFQVSERGCSLRSAARAPDALHLFRTPRTPWRSCCRTAATRAGLGFPESNKIDSRLRERRFIVALDKLPSARPSANL